MKVSVWWDGKSSSHFIALRMDNLWTHFNCAKHIFLTNLTLERTTDYWILPSFSCVCCCDLGHVACYLLGVCPFLQYCPKTRIPKSIHIVWPIARMIEHLDTFTQFSVIWYSILFLFSQHRSGAYPSKYLNCEVRNIVAALGNRLIHRRNYFDDSFFLLLTQ